MKQGDKPLSKYAFYVLISVVGSCAITAEKGATSLATAKNQDVSIDSASDLTRREGTEEVGEGV
jgi:hypothetical protein